MHGFTNPEAAGSIPGPVEGFFGLENFSTSLGIEYHSACHTIYIHALVMASKALN